MNVDFKMKWKGGFLQFWLLFSQEECPMTGCLLSDSLEKPVTQAAWVKRGDRNE